MRYVLALTAALLVGACSSGAFSETKSVDSVVSLKPFLASLQLQVLGVKRAAISLCGAELHSCSEARVMLVLYTQQCSNVFLGIINVGKYSGVPRDLYGTKEPELILFGKPEGFRKLVRIDLIGRKDPDMVAVVLCPEESRVFGSALRMLGGISK